MGDHMRPIPFRELIRRIFEEYRTEQAIFSIPSTAFFRKLSTKTVSLLGNNCEMPLGPAAGPHTQLAQNILSSYLAGSRFIELKTVQEHEPPVDKPCIDVEDEGFNTEWSSEYTVEKAYEEYVKAWVLLHLLEEVFDLRAGSSRSFLFNMSVGYNLEGICSPRMDYYINSLIDASGHPLYRDCLAELGDLLDEGSFLDGTGLENRLSALKNLPDRISPHICSSVTLSTMHGCPPAEIEKICQYMLTEKSLDTYVKLNPTLLSYPVVRDILDKLGYDYVQLSTASFDHDLQYGDAIPMLQRLVQVAAAQGRFFGVKLTNTLGTVNFKQQLPGGEMYMSGRSLFPLSMKLAAAICMEFDGKLPISFSAGVSEHNAAELFATGIRPITLATELLKPGGYGRLSAIAVQIENASDWHLTSIDTAKVAALAEKALTAPYFQKSWRGEKKVTVNKPLPLYDCAVAPCKAACPIGQDIPEYIRLVGEKRYAEALAVIYEKNALPSITGHICDHACQYNCTRLDYEGSVHIREAKRIAVLKGFDQYRANWATPSQQRNVKVAVIGAGPGGLSAAYFLAKRSFAVTVFEQRSAPGGTPGHIIPPFRMGSDAIESDVAFIRDHGVQFIFNCQPDLTVAQLNAEGYHYVIAAIGATAEKPFAMEAPANAPVLRALEFLDTFSHDPAALHLGRRVAVIGAGNTAMDAARSALRVKGVEEVTVVYRRTEKEMPAYREEYELALADKINFRFLLNPESFAEGKLSCRVMKLGQPDATGRRRPESTDERIMVDADAVIVAIGEDIDRDRLQFIGADPSQPGVYVIGDAWHGPSSIVQAIADARQTANAICQAEDSAFEPAGDNVVRAAPDQVAQIAAKKGVMVPASQVPLEGIRPADPAIGENEFRRCLECNYVCNKCVEVCPNRANIAIPIEDARLVNHYQIVHLDAYCNECGNCATFCPWEGKPYQDKVTLFSRQEDFVHSTNPGFLIENDVVTVRCQGDVFTDTLVNGILTAEAENRMGEMAVLLSYLRRVRPSLFGPVDE